MKLNEELTKIKLEKDIQEKLKLIKKKDYL